MMSADTPNAARRVAALEEIIPRPPADIIELREAFSRTVAEQWERVVPHALAGCDRAISQRQFAKARFIGEMYARACYSMLLVSSGSPIALRTFIRIAAALPLSRDSVRRLSGDLLRSIKHLLPKSLHRQLLLISALMGILDVVLDEVASNGRDAALRIASLITSELPTELSAAEKLLVVLAKSARHRETDWQTAYWENMLKPAIRDYCEAEVLATTHTPDSTGMGHRWAGVAAAIKGMWYVIGPKIGLQDDGFALDKDRWNRQQRWMADTSLLMQIIDDWIDQDEDYGARLTLVTAGNWTLQSAAELYEKTIGDLIALLQEGGIRKPTFQALIVDLYRDFLHTAMEAMRDGLAA
jgi:hypothetical protein